MALSRVFFERFAVATTVGTFCLMIMGSYVKAIHAGLACPDWPTCWGVWIPFGVNAPETGFTVHQIAAEWLHRLVAMIVGPMILAMALMAWRLKPVEKPVRFFATTALVILPIQISFGALTVTLLLPPLITVSHFMFATLIFGSLVAATMAAYMSPHRASPAPRVSSAAAPTVMGLVAVASVAAADDPTLTSRPWTGRLQGLLGPWFQLIKPGILLLLVMCGAAAMFLAGTPSLQLVVVTLVGGGLAASSAAAFNNYFDRERDAQMARTKKRPVPSLAIRPRVALVFAVVLEVLSFAVLWRYANLLTAVLALAAVVFYIYYTIWLKPATAQNIVIGGAAGAGPALVGWAAVTGELALPAFILGAIIFLWTPPHFWALALVYKKDYEQAAVPMMPVVAGDESTRRQILVYTLLTVAATLLFLPMQTLGMVYAVSAVVLGGWFVWLAVKLAVRKDNRTAYALFAYSIVYLGLLFGAMVADRLIVSPLG